MTTSAKMDQETYEGLLLVVLATSVKKVKAGLRHAANQYQDYPPGVLELGIALNAIDMIWDDILHFIQINAKDISDNDD